MNLLTNGNFEDCDFTGWTLSGYVDDTWCDNSTNQPNYGPHTGSCYCYSGYSPTPDLSFISQVVTTTKPGIPYSLSFWYRNQPHGVVDNSLEVKWNGATVFSLVNIDYDTLGYRQATVTVLGTGNDTLSFGVFNSNTYTDIDDVTLVSPEPDAPGNVTALPDTGKVTVTWETAQGASGYTVAQGTSNAGPFTILATLTDLVLSYVDTTVVNGATYFYQVCAFNDYGTTCAAPVSSTPQNMAVCTKQFHITTKSYSAAYWTFDVTDPANKVLLNQDSNGAFPDAILMPQDLSPDVWSLFGTTSYVLQWNAGLASYVISVSSGGNSATYSKAGGTGSGTKAEILGDYIWLAGTFPGMSHSAVTIRIPLQVWLDSANQQPLNGTLATNSVPGVIGKGLVLNAPFGINGLIQTLDKVLHCASPAQLSFWCWVKNPGGLQLTVYQTGHTKGFGIVTGYNFTTPNEFGLAVVLGVGNEWGGSNFPTAPGAFFAGDLGLPGSWTLLCASYDGVNLKFWQDNHAASVTAVAGYADGEIPSGAFDQLTINSGQGAASGGQGNIDELGILTTHALTDADVLFLYNSGAGVTWPAVQAHFGL